MPREVAGANGALLGHVLQKSNRSDQGYTSMASRWSLGRDRDRRGSVRRSHDILAVTRYRKKEESERTVGVATVRGRLLADRESAGHFGNQPGIIFLQGKWLACDDSMVAANVWTDSEALTS